MRVWYFKDFRNPSAILQLEILCIYRGRGTCPRATITNREKWKQYRKMIPLSTTDAPHDTCAPSLALPMLCHFIIIQFFRWKSLQKMPWSNRPWWNTPNTLVQMIYCISILRGRTGKYAYLSLFMMILGIFWMALWTITWSSEPCVKSNVNYDDGFGTYINIKGLEL